MSSTTLKSTAKDTWKHDQVNRTQKECVRYENGPCITTNTVESFFNILKRGIAGTYHHVGKGHLHRYLTEFDFRYNSREVSDVERRNLAIQKVGGKAANVPGLNKASQLEKRLNAEVLAGVSVRSFPEVNPVCTLGAIYRRSLQVVLPHGLERLRG